MIKGVAVGIARGVAECGNMTIVKEIASLDIVGYVGPHDIFADAVPSNTFGPKIAGMSALDGGVADLVFCEFGIKDDDIGFGITHR